MLAVPMSSLHATVVSRTDSSAVPTVETRSDNQPESCAHCSLPLPVGRPFAEFCCPGCRAVHAVITDLGYQRFYELGGGRGNPVGAAPRHGDDAWIDEFEAARQTADRGADALVNGSIDVQGVHCAACVWLLQELWRRTPGAVRFELNPTIGRAEVTYRGSSRALHAFAKEVERVGYRVGRAGKRVERSDRGLLTRMGVCLALAMNAMMFAFAGYSGMSAADGVSHRLFQAISAAIAAAAVAVGGPVYLRAALAGLRRGVLHFDLPIALGIGLAFGSSLIVWLTGRGEPYFDTVTIFVALMLVGRYVQQRAVSRNRSMLLADDGAEHLRAKRVRDGVVERVAALDLVAGDEIVLAVGDLVPTDVVLIDRSARFSTEWISGESEEREFVVGATVPAGAFLAGRCSAHARVACTVADSGILRLLASPASTAVADDPSTRFWRRLNRIYVIVVLGLAALAALIWTIVDAGRALEIATAVLVITCPCALGLATPLAMETSVASLRRRGIFVRRQELLAKARCVRTVIFDKTGTLTWGGLRARVVRDVEPQLRDVLYTMVAASSHPVSEAIAKLLTSGGAVRLLPQLAVREHPGAGLSAVHDGIEFRLGNASFALGDHPLDTRDSTAIFTRGGHVEAVFSLEEDFRAGIEQSIAALRDRGLRVMLLSGDRNERVAEAAQRLGIETTAARGGLRPEDKARIVAEVDRRDTLMVGDGINDALAFDAAFCAGTPALDRPVMPARSDFFYSGGGSDTVNAILDVADRFHRVLRRNLIMAVGYNSVAVLLAVLGLMSPLLCAVLMPISSIALIVHTRLAFRGVIA